MATFAMATMTIYADTPAYSHSERVDLEAVEILSRARFVGIPVWSSGNGELGFRYGSIATKEIRRSSSLIHNES
jgi:hypothetical protein